ncbi:unannotated protein [freshwater metagenome]|uniref:Unannotated protein n=1 Tax=freshwater metagenome TaxID=449393 RepID=A0A6J6REN3_9ZZZZ
MVVGAVVGAVVVGGGVGVGLGPQAAAIKAKLAIAITPLRRPAPTNTTPVTAAIPATMSNQRARLLDPELLEVEFKLTPWASRAKIVGSASTATTPG